MYQVGLNAHILNSMLAITSPRLLHDVRYVTETLRNTNDERIIIFLLVLISIVHMIAEPRWRPIFILPFVRASPQIAQITLNEDDCPWVSWCTQNIKQAAGEDWHGKSFEVIFLYFFATLMIEYHVFFGGRRLLFWNWVSPTPPTPHPEGGNG